MLSKLHSRAREPETACCAGVTCTKSLDRTEIPQWIYDSRDGLGLFTRDPIEYEGSEWNLYEYGLSSPAIYADPSGECAIKCCCCAESVIFRNVRAINTATHWGHSPNGAVTY